MERTRIATEKKAAPQPRAASWLDKFIFADLLASAVLSVLAFGAVEPWSLAMFELNALLLAVLLALKFVVDPRFDLKRLQIALPVFALVLLGVVQILPFGSSAPINAPEDAGINDLTTRALSLDPQATREAVVKLLALAIYFVAALHTLRDSSRRRIALLTLTIFGFVVSIFAIAQRLTYNGMMYWVRPVSAYVAPYGPYGNYNHFAGMVELILPLPLAYALIARIGAEQRALWIFSVVMMAVATIFSLSRGGMLALAAEVTVLLLIGSFLRSRRNQAESLRTKTNRRILITVTVTAVITIALWIGYEPLVKRFVTIKQGASEYSVVTRVEYWRASWQMFLDHPMLGVGLGAFPAIYPSYGRSSAKYERLEQAHNDYLQLLTDAGLAGAMIGLWSLVEIVRVARAQWRELEKFRSRDRAVVIGGYTAVFGLLIHSFTDFNLQIAANALLFLLSVALATSLDPNGKQSYDDK
ncbi:MAG: O-antigen ligase family protein [Blastocatellales bacterium]